MLAKVEGPGEEEKLSQSLVNKNFIRVDHLG